MSAQARRERAYRHYVQKQMKKRQREIARAQKAANRQMKRQMKNMQPSEPQVTTTVQQAPNAESSSNAWAEPVTAPITVSASDSIDGRNPDQPSPP